MSPGEKDLRRKAELIRWALYRAAEEYANGIEKKTPIVDRHFTAGNQQRYGWEPLSQEHFEQKAKSLTVKNGNALVLNHKPGQKGYVRSKLDKKAGYKGRFIAQLTGTNLPMLVRTGTLRAATNSKTHKVTRSADGNSVTVLFQNLPEYAKYLHEGTAKMPKRSPVEPSAEDYAEVIAIARRHIDTLLGTGSKTPQAFRGAKARMV